ncbi:MAG: glycosyltransferase family 2 protein [Acidimicrobiia bacterium]
MTDRWAAVVVNYDAGDHLVPCVRSLLVDDSCGAAPGVVVVDNGSTDGSCEALARACPDVVILRPGTNLGYARAANLGIAATDAPVVAVCNPDLVLGPGTAAAMLARLDGAPRLAAVGPSITNPDGSVYPSARRVPSVGDAVGHGLLGLVWPSNPFTRRYRQLDADWTEAREVDWVSGAAIWLRRDALDDVGGWDERYFMYVEDVDLCWRLRRAGWSVLYEPAGHVLHVQGVSTARRPVRMIVEHHRSLYRFAKRRWTGWRRVLLPPAAVYLAVRAALAILVHSVPGRRRAARVNG